MPDPKIGEFPILWEIWHACVVPISATEWECWIVAWPPMRSKSASSRYERQNSLKLAELRERVPSAVLARSVDSSDKQSPYLPVLPPLLLLHDFPTDQPVCQ